MDGLSEAFRIVTGVKQCDVLSPFLFLLVIDYDLRMIEKDGYGINFAGEKLFDLDFADEIALLEKSKRFE